MFKFFDCHCDTITTCIRENQNMRKNNLHIDFERLMKFEKAVQVFAVWIDKEENEKIFEKAMEAIKFYKNQVKENSGIIDFIKSGRELKANIENKKISGLLAIEGGECLEGKIENLKKFYNEGVRILTLSWNYENEIGYGAMTQSNEGLKEFGREVIANMNKMGIIADVSHLNEKGFWEVYAKSERPFIASHSNSYEICKNKRNLTDRQIKAIREKEGIIGINLFPKFLNESEQAEIEDIIIHIKYIKKLIGEDNIGFGCDYDGIDYTPKGLENIEKIEKLKNAIDKEFGEKFAEKIFFENFYKFLVKEV